MTPRGSPGFPPPPLSPHSHLALCVGVKVGVVKELQRAWAARRHVVGGGRQAGGHQVRQGRYWGSRSHCRPRRRSHAPAHTPPSRPSPTLSLLTFLSPTSPPTPSSPAPGHHPRPHHQHLRLITLSPPSTHTLNINAKKYTKIIHKENVMRSN